MKYLSICTCNITKQCIKKKRFGRSSSDWEQMVAGAIYATDNRSISLAGDAPNT